MKLFTPLTAAFALALLPACAQEAAEQAGSDMEMAASDEMAMESMAQEPDCFVRGDLEGRLSSLESTSTSFGDVMVKVCYGAPLRRDPNNPEVTREIMGALVPYDAPWRMGANEATAIYLSAAASVGGVALDAGAYSIYATPTMGDWTVHINSVNERWGIPIGPEVTANDVGSFTVTPGMVGDAVDQLRYTFSDADGGADLVMEWEQTSISIPIRSN